jgi:lipopolysaccharide transport system permease protein
MKKWANLVYELARRNLRTRYSSFFSAALWMFLFPLLTVGIFYAVFSVILKVKIEEAPFILYLMTSVFTWQFFHDSVMASTTSLVDSRNLLKESNFPSYLVPVSIIFANMAIFTPSLAITVLISALILKGLPIFIVFLPFVFLTQVIMITGLSIIFSVIYPKQRDIKYILEACFTLFFYLTPAFYSIRLIKNTFSVLLYNCYIYNPFTGMLTLYRSVLLKGFYAAIKEDMGIFAMVFPLLVFSLAVFLLGCYYYNRSKKVTNDYLSY